MLVSGEQVDDYVLNLRGRLNYETKKARKLGFSNIQDYVRDKLTKEAEALELSLNATPSIKTAKPERVKKESSTCKFMRLLPLKPLVSFGVCELYIASSPLPPQMI